MKFTHLHNHSHYSLLDGVVKIDELIKATKEDGQTALALTDHGVMEMIERIENLVWLVGVRSHTIVFK